MIPAKNQNPTPSHPIYGWSLNLYYSMGHEAHTNKFTKNTTNKEKAKKKSLKPEPEKSLANLAEFLKIFL